MSTISIATCYSEMLEIQRTVLQDLDTMRKNVLSKCLDIGHVEQIKNNFRGYRDQLSHMRSQLRGNNSWPSAQVPKRLDGDVTDSDGLYKPNFQFTFSSPPQTSLPSTSTSHDLHLQRIEAANNQHLQVASNPPRLSKHSETGAGTGCYTCTYRGCTQRFNTPALLQKHKREHQQAQEGLSRPSIAVSLFGTQAAGPTHNKCERINPSTGKPCNAIFSRPCDLTRHEDVIHNGRKQKIGCDVCIEEKTFSRPDAIRRHYRVCHPGLEFPGSTTGPLEQGSHQLNVNQTDSTNLRIS